MGVVRLWYKNEFLQSLGFAALKTLNGNCVFLIGLVAITPSRAQFTGKASFLVIFLAYISR